MLGIRMDHLSSRYLVSRRGDVTFQEGLDVAETCNFEIAGICGPFWVGVDFLQPVFSGSP